MPKNKIITDLFYKYIELLNKESPQERLYILMSIMNNVLEKTKILKDPKKKLAIKLFLGPELTKFLLNPELVKNLKKSDDFCQKKYKELLDVANKKIEYITPNMIGHILAADYCSQRGIVNQEYQKNLAKCYSYLNTHDKIMQVKLETILHNLLSLDRGSFDTPEARNLVKGYLSKYSYNENDLNEIVMSLSFLSPQLDIKNIQTALLDIPFVLTATSDKEFFNAVSKECENMATKEYRIALFKHQNALVIKNPIIIKLKKDLIHIENEFLNFNYNDDKKNDIIGYSSKPKKTTKEFAYFSFDPKNQKEKVFYIPIDKSHQIKVSHLPLKLTSLSKKNSNSINKKNLLKGRDIEIQQSNIKQKQKNK